MEGRIISFKINSFKFIIFPKVRGYSIVAYKATTPYSFSSEGGLEENLDYLDSIIANNIEDIPYLCLEFAKDRIPVSENLVFEVLYEGYENR